MVYRTRNRIRNDTPTPGSAFHELVVLPTFAPQLARPYRVPGMDTVYNMEFANQTQDPADPDRGAVDHNAGATDSGSQEEQAVEHTAQPPTPVSAIDLAPDRTFSLYVTLLFLEKQQSTSRNGKAKASKQCSLTKVHPMTIPALKCSRSEFVCAILTAHGLEKRFQAHSQSGPDFRIWWKGSVGGKSAAPTIQIDEDWKKACEDLARQSRVTDLSVVIDSSCLSPRFEKVKVGSLPNEFDSDEEIVPSTKVPEVADFSQETQALAGTIDELKAEWNCTTDGPCYVMSNGQHVPLTKFRLFGWAGEIKAGRGTVKDPPSNSLLTHWGVIPSQPVKPRGRTGPSTTTNTGPTTSATDPIAAMLAVIVPLVTTLLTQQLKAVSGPMTPSTPHHGSKRQADSTPPADRSPKRARYSHQHSDRSLSPSPSRSLSPLPAVEHELESCLLAFGNSKALADNIINSAITNLATLGYTPDVLADNDISNERVREVSGLPEGTVSALRRFSRDWCARLEVKKARAAK